jgi:SSS family solute:Na+ symporter
MFNLLVAVIVTFILRATKTPDGVDGTTADDYFADENDPRLEKGRTSTEELASSA